MATNRTVLAATAWPGAPSSPGHHRSIPPFFIHQPINGGSTSGSKAIEGQDAPDDHRGQRALDLCAGSCHQRHRDETEDATSAVIISTGNAGEVIAPSWITYLIEGAPSSRRLRIEAIITSR